MNLLEKQQIERRLTRKYARRNRMRRCQECGARGYFHQARDYIAQMRDAFVYCSVCDTYQDVIEQDNV